MVALPKEWIEGRIDPTLAAIDRELERREAGQPRRTYLGASQIGEPCERKLWYSIQPDVPREAWEAATLRRFEDGHRSEAVMAERLRLVPGVELATVDANGEQFGFTDFGGRFQGHADGFIRGLLQAPVTPCVWEHKSVNEKRFAEFNKLKKNLDEKAVLQAWDPVYYAQGVMYMGYFDLTRHYLTVSTPGCRDVQSCRTDANPRMFDALREKARRIIEAEAPPARISERKEFYYCKWCQFREICHG